MKKIGKTLFAIFTAAFISSGLYGASIEQICNQLAAHPVTKGDFVQVKTITTAKGARELKSNGTFIFGIDGIMWNTLKPFPSKMVVTKNRIIQTDAKGNENIIDGTDNPTFASVASTISAVFSNDLTLLKQNFDVSFTDKGNGAWEMKLVPKDTTITSVMGSLVVGGRYTSTVSSLDSIVMYETSDNKITYKFTNQTYPKELSTDEKNLFGVR